MKQMKWMPFILLLLLLLSACSFSKDKDNSVLLYGNEADADAATDPYQSKLQSQSLYHVKETSLDGLKIIVINKTTSLQIMDQKLFHKENDPDTSATLPKLEQLDDKHSILLSPSKYKQPVSAHFRMTDIIYGGNIMVGTDNYFSDAILIVEDSMYDAAEGKEKSLSFMKFHKMKDAKKAYQDIKGIMKKKMSVD
ncbi:lipoprotein BA_5634 family protein [Bacillus sp. 1P06AnD]|uniref:lipoprotein BA_5634 family protein n=1 Tax=Bacillus sp. 1P06AnD TaxID=3132208 RepID=UPI00399F1398